MRGRVRDQRFEVFGVSNPELQTSNRTFPAHPTFPACLARRARRAGIALSSVLDSPPPMNHSPQHLARTLPYKPSPSPAADPRVTFHASRFTVRPISVLLALLCVVSTACGTTAPTGKILFDDPRGTVSQQTMSDQSIQASHPINLEPTLLAKVLRGIEIQDQ